MMRRGGQYRNRKGLLRERWPLCGTEREAKRDQSEHREKEGGLRDDGRQKRQPESLQKWYHVGKGSRLSKVYVKKGTRTVGDPFKGRRSMEKKLGTRRMPSKKPARKKNKKGA